MAGAGPHDRGDPSLPFLISLTVHLGLGALLYAAAELWGSGLWQPSQDGAGWLVEVTVPVEPEPVVEPEPEPEPDPEPEVEPEPVVAEPVTKAPVTATPPRVARTPTPVAPILDPAPGPVDPRTPAPVYRLPDQGEGGSIPVPEGRPPPRGPYGSGGTGTGTGGGGGSNQGAGPPAPPPVSVAAIKRRAKPIGDTDFVDARDDYPPEAKRQGIEGQVKIRLVVDATGIVAERRLVKKLGYGLDELAMQLAKRLRFEPAIDTTDSPVRSVVVWTFNFTLPG
jgi:protein TonB